ncbi:MAG TPA: ATP-binding protein [Verrucomicrobiae bacterium]|jgi:NtrC-family two-component system sensor histidine kinase KinB|nr:ATP-binding protein [Verrucomicrobiae bacterium]
MDYLQRLTRQAKLRLFIVILSDNAVLIGGWWLGNKILGLSALELGALLLAIAIIETSVVATSLGSYLMQPVKALWQTILHVAPGSGGVAAPKPESLGFGRELVTSLSTHIYELTAVAEHSTATSQQQGKDLSHNFIAQSLPLPLFVLDPSETIKFANEAAAAYIGIQPADMIGKNIYMVLDMSFPSEATFDTWLKQVKLKSATASASWERVRLNVRDNHPARLFDLAAYYNRDNPEHIETILALFDHTKQYSQDDQAISFIALSVHELRTPLTLLRGYIEVFDEELSGKVDAELQGFIMKMRAQADQLMAFVNNILNVARIDDDQLELQLEEEQWPAVLKSAIEALSLRAKIQGITFHCRIATNLPTVGVDRLSIHEVINNLIDNAIKYSGTSKVIEIDAHLTKDGLVETTIQDFGLGISTSIMSNLFTKFYRDHRNRAQIGGTGLGLYLSKAIVTAHGGSIWVRSHEGQGSTFGFTLIPYAQLTEELKRTGNQEITRGAHGWIKNHSLYRR